MGISLIGMLHVSFKNCVLNDFTSNRGPFALGDNNTEFFKSLEMGCMVTNITIHTLQQKTHRCPLVTPVVLKLDCVIYHHRFQIGITGAPNVFIGNVGDQRL